tara:strand:+ start:358 stop:483 length:126 start_codon:yes stop_codon:yes gene_type:complete
MVGGNVSGRLEKGEMRANEPDATRLGMKYFVSTYIDMFAIL